MTKINEELKKQRKKAKISQGEMAERLKVSRSTIYRFEHGTMDLPSAKLIAYANSVGYLIFARPLNSEVEIMPIEILKPTKK